MTFSKAGFSVLAGVLATALPTVSYSADSGRFVQIPKLGQLPAPTLEGTSLDRLRNAYESLRQDKAIQTLLDDQHLNALTISDRITGQDLETTKFQHFFKGVEVVGSLAFHHQGKEGTEIRDYLSHFNLDTTPTISDQAATALATGIVGDRGLQVKPELKILPNLDSNGAKLVYWVSLDKTEDEAGRDVVIDAHSGRVLASISHHQEFELAPIQVYSAKGQGISATSKRRKIRKLAETITSTCQIVDPASGAPIVLNPRSCPQVVINSKSTPKADSGAKQAASNSEKVLAYYKNSFNRNSYDGKGSESVSVVHVGQKFDNAFWSSDENIMAYGDGDGEKLGDFTRAVDVAGHEMTHGVTSKTARLIYMSESGALNEAFSDFFGILIANDGTEWRLGRDLFLDTSNSGFRNPANPGTLHARIRDTNGKIIAVPYPATMKEKIADREQCDGSNDHCWVHINSTIPSHAMYLVFDRIGKEKAEKLFYTLLTQRLGPSATFKIFASEARTGCKQVLDKESCSQVDRVFASVGL